LVDEVLAQTQPVMVDESQPEAETAGSAVAP
jgi:hypothetical protein